MYVGRIVSVGLSANNQICIMYRVSSRSFPNRAIKEINGSLAVIPMEGREHDIYQNPYISYNCLRRNERFAVVGNGTHTDPIIEKLESGMNMRDSLISVLFGMDYEHDALDTPRIAAIADKQHRSAALGIIRKDGIEVKEFELEIGCYRFISTYEKNYLSSEFCGCDLEVNNVEAATQFILNYGKFRIFTNPVSAAAALESNDGFVIASHNLNGSS